MWVCGQFYRHTFIGEALNIIGGLIFSLGLTLIPIIGYCVKMSMEKNKARREQIDATDLDYHPGLLFLRHFFVLGSCLAIPLAHLFRFLCGDCELNLG